ncbi:MAG: 5'/3'-nucleotidase SurE [Verrucomicrobiota bacterium]
MIILITNDDGIDADGLKALKKAASGLGEIFTVAPAGAMSQVGHRVTTEKPIPVEEIDERAWAVDGTPADCVRVAIKKLLPKKPDWVLSGINHGGNMGHDIYISGTIAAVREAAFHGLQGIALSHYLRNGVPLDWEVSGRRVTTILEKLLGDDLDPGEHWNVNLPHIHDHEPEPEVHHTEPDPAPLPVDFEDSAEGLTYRGVYAERLRAPGSDVAVCFGGQISVSKLKI